MRYIAEVMAMKLVNAEACEQTGKQKQRPVPREAKQESVLRNYAARKVNNLAHLQNDTLKGCLPLAVLSHLATATSIVSTDPIPVSADQRSTISEFEAYQRISNRCRTIECVAVMSRAAALNTSEVTLARSNGGIYLQR